MELKELQIVCQVLLCCFSGIYNIPVEQLYEFGEANGDTKCPIDEDFSLEVPISANFPFLGFNHSQVYVNEHGGISMNQPYYEFEERFENDGGPKNYIRRILAFFTDISTKNGGDIWYRQTTDFGLLHRATSEIRRVFPRHNSFTATWMFLTTWHDVDSYYNIDKRNTFQIVLVTDEVTSFFMLLYARLEWGEAGGWDYLAVAGYTAGDGVNFYLFPESLKPSKMITLSEKSNVGIPGVFIFDVAPPTIAPGPIVPVECPEIVILNGSVEYSPNRESGSILNIACNEGLSLIGENEIVCDSDGTWSATIPVCEELRCQLPEEINHGFVTIATTESIKYGCDPGYTLVCGDEVMSCGLDGSWEGIIPHCIAITNGRVGYIPDGDSGGIINITCNHGFNLIGEEAIVCGLEGSWADSLPVCEEMNCPLQEINNGFVTGENNYGSSITYDCDPGYKMVCGDEVMSCGLYGKWDGIIPLCIAITNGSVEYNHDRDSGGIINITCDDGFNLIGEEALVCDLDGIWADSLPVCEEMDCQMQEINNGFVNGEHKYGGSITYGCDPGYTLVCGDEVMSCVLFGVWDGIIPHCIAILNGSVVYSRDEGSAGIINLTCDDGFNLIGEEAVVCDLDGTWADSLPVCEEIRCPLQEINYGFVSGENTYGSSIRYGCDPGYTLVCGDEVMSCGLSGIWDGFIPHCIAITNGSVEYSPDEGSGGIINITCDEGFNLIGEGAVVCDLDGTWSDGLPVCEEIRCPLQEINNGFVTGENNYGSSITYGCDPGYTLVCGDEVMSCGLFGIWDGIIPHCIAITNGSVEYSRDEGSGGIINITCDEGFNLIGEGAVVCDLDGTWSDSLPVCEEITCPLQEINHGFVTGENTYGDSITFGCEPGYALVCGDEVMSCGLDGSWDGIIPFCIWRGKSNVSERNFEGNVDDNEGQFCRKLRERNGDFGQRPEKN